MLRYHSSPSPTAHLLAPSIFNDLTPFNAAAFLNCKNIGAALQVILHGKVRNGMAFRSWHHGTVENDPSQQVGNLYFNPRAFIDPAQ